MIKYVFKSLILIGFLFLVVSCQDEVYPKPPAFLRLNYPQAEYIGFESQCPFVFDINSNEAKQIEIKSNCAITIKYPTMKASLFLTYREVNQNIDTLLMDAQKLTFEHVIKADEIMEVPFMKGKDKVYGMFYEVGGDAATNAQFYLTDSVKHFVTGSVYFYTKPNFDSIMPATSYIKDDMKTLMETLRWKE
uniref:gliding motility lipoprotein GldD n=2 Tax=Flavobacterium sp. TaxID=239 RepID=UPI00404B16E0